MDVRVGLLFLFALGSKWTYADARSLVISHVSVMQINYEEPKIKIPALNAGDERLCTYCEKFAAQALSYLGENKTETEIIETLHQACSRLHTFRQECVSLVDYYAPLFFVEIATIRPENFCKKVNLCEDAAFVSPPIYQDSCTLCHQAVVEVLMKLKDPDTRLEIIELLLKGCDKVERYLKECKKLVFEYGPLILTNGEQFLETHDVCASIHACKDSGVEAGMDSSLLEVPSSELEFGSQDS